MVFADGDGEIGSGARRLGAELREHDLPLLRSGAHLVRREQVDGQRRRLQIGAAGGQAVADLRDLAVQRLAVGKRQRFQGDERQTIRFMCCSGVRKRLARPQRGFRKHPSNDGCRPPAP
ncbi:hypothetical protein AB6806_19840 [Bosea sp. RCC_152_1]|uniref:hypothetical protein n=1 Tax=Bosea sp. RCC_152_1 TaxID=3239228 RepID=UPI0035259161